MAGTTFMKIVIIVLCMNILLYVNGVRVIDTSNDFMERFISVDNKINGTGNLTLSQRLNETQISLKTFSQSGAGTGVLAFVDALKTVKDVAVFFINIVFTPFGLFLALPQQMALIIGLPLTIISLLGLIYFIRSGN